MGVHAHRYGAWVSKLGLQGFARFEIERSGGGHKAGAAAC